eukprot:TRINITY_DN6848_c0_g1_i1.p1 TRINITY_DN6848_c0_g1~~TRINITY_DN6848_c0_g1_i1.p1  ORF type:complete len:433 (+),score=74.42 TRINITY_DN6848_c0_g1_i1:57-1301(+)
MKTSSILLLASLVSDAAAIDNGLGLRPPMGWRSWNYFKGNIDQTIMENMIDQMVATSRGGKSLRDFGYIDVGLDDAWQACGTGYKQSFHDDEGNPLVNKTRFPSMADWVAKAHSNNLTAGWYMNNCICREHLFTNQTYITMHMERSVEALVEAKFDGVKLDGCGQFSNITWFADLFNKTGRPVMIETCHGGNTVPGQTTGDAPCTGTTMPSNCPYNFFRSSHDIQPDWSSMFHNLQSTIPFQDVNVPLSRPGTWAYPDMLQVGNMPTVTEDRTHFGAWCIVSSPLTLGMDMSNDTVMDRVWPIITNTEAIAVNQAWFGHPGRLLNTTVDSIGNTVYQVWIKKMSDSGNKLAVFVINNSGQTEAISLDMTLFGFSAQKPVTVRDLWNHKDLPSVQGSFNLGNVISHDSRFFILEQ